MTLTQARLRLSASEKVFRPQKSDPTRVAIVQIPETYRGALTGGWRSLDGAARWHEGKSCPDDATIDSTMIKAIARAFRWQRLLENGTYGCLEEIAKAEKIGASFVSRLVRLALLAPDIVEAILVGTQPANLTLKDLMLPFPVEWAGQRVQFGVRG